MDWAERTYWVRQSVTGPLDYAITSDLDADVLGGLLELDSPLTRLASAQTVEPCSLCPFQQACMSSVWVEGKRMAGPLAGEASFSEVLACPYCISPMLALFRRGPENPVPSNCPRQTGKSGQCDGCRQFYASLPETSPEVLTEDKVLAHQILATVLSDVDLEEAYGTLTEETRVECARRMVSLLAGLLNRDPDSNRCVRALVLELADGPLEKAWISKSSAARRFLIRCWEGVVRQACLV